MDPHAKATTTDAPHKPDSTSTHRSYAGRRTVCIVIFLLVALGALAADLGLKTYAFHHVAGTPVILDPASPNALTIPFHDPTVLIPGVLSLRLTTNTGAIFGMGKGSRWVFITVSIIAVGFIGRVFWRSPANALILHIALAMILAGALGNLYDRIRFAAVRDMLHLFPDVDLPFGLSWPGQARGLYPWIFNLADVALLLGVLTVVWVTWKHAPPRSTSQTNQD
jgi:signal peptidase II